MLFLLYSSLKTLYCDLYYVSFIMSYDDVNKNLNLNTYCMMSCCVYVYMQQQMCVCVMLFSVYSRKGYIMSCCVYCLWQQRMFVMLFLVYISKDYIWYVYSSKSVCNVVLVYSSKDCMV